MKSLMRVLAAIWPALLAVWGADPAPSPVAAELDRILSQEYQPGAPGAAVLVSRAGQVILKKSYGLADTGRQTPVGIDTVFRLASVTKVFTGTAILMLAEQGKLDVEAPAATYLPAYPTLAQGITVGRLLSHTSGVANYLDRPDSMQWARNEYTVQQLIDSFKDRPASFAPGEKSVYSNSNYVLLGAIIENVSGLSYGEFLKRRIFDPLGMKGTFCGGSLAGVPRLASAYEPAGIAAGQPDWNRLVVARPYTMTALYAAGGCLSSLEDLAKFNDALRKGTLLSREVLVRSYQPVALNNGALASTSYGGWQLDRINGRRAAMRGGALPGVCTWLLTMPDEDVTVILLTNRTPGQPRCGMLAVRLAGMALGASGL